MACVIKERLMRTYEQLSGTLGHEFGHLSYGHTERILIISIGNIFVTRFCAMIPLWAHIIELFAHITCGFPRWQSRYLFHAYELFLYHHSACSRSLHGHLDVDWYDSMYENQLQ